MDRHATQLLYTGLAPNTRSTYASAQKRYLNFCSTYGLNAVPIDEQTSARFIAHLSLSAINVRSIRVYLSAVRDLHVMSGLQPPEIYTPRIKLMMKSLHKSHDQPKQVKPITFRILLQCYSLFTQTRDDLMMWSAITLCFFGCLRASELFPPITEIHFAPRLSDLIFCKDEVPYLQLKVHKSKTAPHGFKVVIGCSGTNVCAYCSVAKYVKISGLLPSSFLFSYSTGQMVTKYQFLCITRLMLLRINLDPCEYSTHSYRAGAATSASMSGFSEHEIKQLGHWKSDVYQSYIRDNYKQLAAFSSRIAQS